MDLFYWCVCVHMRVCVLTQLCPALCNPKDCSPPGSSVHGDCLGKTGLPFLPAGDLPDPGTEPEEPATPVSPALAGGFFTTETLGKPYICLLTT